MNSRSQAIIPERITKGLSRKMRQVTQTLMETLTLKDSYTSGHGVRVGEFAEHIARALDLEEHETAEIVLAATLHDIGKVGIPDSILLKKGALTSAEWSIVRRHPEFGWWSLRHIEEMERVGLMLLHHHEHFNGSGYPLGLAGSEIPLGARIISVADAFDAMTTDRSYRKAMPVQDAMEELMRCKGTQFDPLIVEAFLSALTPTL
jgi:HD-GYP domain-containing protein (c-di-GMP phosphodiesterase class II)